MYKGGSSQQPDNLVGVSMQRSEHLRFAAFEVGVKRGTELNLAFEINQTKSFTLFPLSKFLRCYSYIPYLPTVKLQLILQQLNVFESTWHTLQQ